MDASGGPADATALDGDVVRLQEDGETAMYVAIDGRAAGVVAVADTIEEDSIEAAPVRLNFTRLESSLCSEMVIFDGIDRSARLPEGETVVVEFTPQALGEILFRCQVGMLRGKVVVTK